MGNKNKWKKITNASKHKCRPLVLAEVAIFSRMRAWGRGALPINKMAGWFDRFSSLYSSWHYTQICVARGNVSWGSEDNAAAGELQLWYRERDNDYYLCASKTTGVCMKVCKVIDVFTLHFQKCTDKIKTLLTKKSKFHFVQYWKQKGTMWEWTDKGISSRGSRVRTKFYGSIIVSRSDRVLTMYNLIIIYTEPFPFKKLAYLCVYAVTLMYLLQFSTFFHFSCNLLKLKQKKMKLKQKKNKNYLR